MLTESLYPCIMKMVSANVCRALPPPTDDFDPEEDEPVLELSWPHLQVNNNIYWLAFDVDGDVFRVVARWWWLWC